MRAIDIFNNLRQDREVEKLKRAYNELQLELDLKIRKLDQRVRELSCLYSIADLGEQPGISKDELISKAITYLLPTLFSSGIVCARAIVDGQEFTTRGFIQTHFKYSSDIVG